MAEETDKKIKEKDIVGLKCFDQPGKLLQQLHEVGCERDRADNRTLHMDQYCVLVLLYLFNPICSSLRAVQQASALPQGPKATRLPESGLRIAFRSRRGF